jgi:pentose-5-phosphate-3-epimerase
MKQPTFYRSYFDTVYSLGPAHIETKHMSRTEAVAANIELVKEYQAAIALEIQAGTPYGHTKSVLQKWYATQKPTP